MSVPVTIKRHVKLKNIIIVMAIVSYFQVTGGGMFYIVINEVTAQF